MKSMSSQHRSQSTIRMTVFFFAGLLMVWMAGCAGGRRAMIGGDDLARAEFDKRLELQLEDIISAVPGGPDLNEPVSITFIQMNKLAVLDRKPPRIIVLDAQRGEQQQAAGAGKNQMGLRRPRVIRSGFGLTLNIADESGSLLVYDGDLRLINSFEPSYEASGFTGGSPAGLAIADFGDTYLADRTNDIVYHFDPSGKFVATIGGSDAGAGRLNQPEGLAVTDDGRLIVCDAGAGRVVIFDPMGEFVTSLGDGRLQSPVAAAVAPNNQAVFICDGGTPSRLALYDLDGRFLREWDGLEAAVGEFGELTDVGILGTSLYLVDTGKSRILVYRMIPPER
jgi:DNA-binding beta-propeller fold protein YncE